MPNDERTGIRPGIDPLSDAAWARVERGVWASLDADAPVESPVRRRGPRWRLALAPLALAAVIAIIVVGVRAPGERAVVGEPSRVVSGASPSTISFGDIHVELDPETALAMSHETGRPIAVLERGAAWFTVAPRGERPPVLVRAGDATVRVIGTRFRVARADERITVAVEHGVVDVAYRGEHHAVSASQRWSSQAPSGVETAAALAPAQTTPDPAASPAAASPAAASPAAASPAAASPAAASRSAASPSAASPSAASPSSASPSSASPAPAASPAVAPATPPARSSSSSRSATSASPPSSPSSLARSPDAADRAEYERLTALEARSSDRAISGYLALARRSGPWAGPALFAAARLAADRGDPRAAALLDTYLQRFPTGANADDARGLRQRITRESR